MKRNMLLVPFIAVVTLLMVSLAFAATDLTRNERVELNSEVIGLNNELASFAGDTVPIRVTFTANVDSDDVKIDVSLYDGRDDVSAVSGRFNIVAGKTYTKLLSLRLPTDVDEVFEEFTLSVEIYDADHDTKDYDEDYRISMQRESYVYEILSVDYSTKVSAGDVFPVSVVVKNQGFNRMDDTYVVVSIPALGVSTRGYVGDLIPNEDYIDYDDEEDSLYRTVYLKIPADTIENVYEMEVEVYNDDASVVVTKLLSVSDSESSMVLATVKNQDLNAGETVTYDLVIVNSADKIKVFEINSVSGDVLSVSAPSVVTVGSDSSEIVSITVKAADDAAIGTYTFSVDVDGKQTVFSANVVGGSSTSTSIVALTVILVIVLIVLLAVFAVLLTKKEKPIEEVETSYY